MFDAKGPLSKKKDLLREMTAEAAFLREWSFYRPYDCWRFVSQFGQ
jgi:hypothetical protein